MDFHCTTPGLQTTSASPSEADAVLGGKTEKTKKLTIHCRQELLSSQTLLKHTRHEGWPEPGIYLKQTEAMEVKR